MSTVKSQLSGIARNATQHGTPLEGVYRCPICYVAHPTSDKLIACITAHEKASARTVCAVVLCENDATTTDSAGRKVCAGCADDEPAKTRKRSRSRKAKAVQVQEQAPVEQVQEQAPVEQVQAPKPAKTRKAKAVQAPVQVQEQAPKSADVWAKECRRIDKRFADTVHQKALFSGPRLHAGALNLDRIREHATESARVVIFAQGNQYAAIGADGKVHCAMQVDTLQDWHTLGATVYGMVKGAKGNQGSAQAPQTIVEPVQAQAVQAPKPAKTRKAQKAVQVQEQAPVEQAPKPAKTKQAKAVQVASEATGASAQAVQVAHNAPADVQGALVDAISALSVGVRALSHLVTMQDD